MLKADIRERLDIPAVWRYGLSVVTVAVALTVTYLLQPYLFRTQLFFLAIMIGAWVGGTGPGLLAVLLSTLCMSFFLNPEGVPVNRFLDVTNVATFLATALMAGAWSAARRRSEYALQHAGDNPETKIQERTAELCASHNQSREHEFRTIVENAPDQIIRYDREFRRVYVNPAVAQAYGLPAQALTGKPIGSVIQDAGVHVNEDELAQLRQRIAAVFDSGKSSEFEITWPLPTGRKSFSVRVFPEMDAGGSVVNVLGIAQDITERKQADEALRRSEDHLHLAVDTIPLIAWSLRPDGTVDFLNQRWVDYSGLSLEQFVAEPTRPIHPEDVRRVMEKWRASTAAGEPYVDEMRLRRSDGEYRWHLVRTAPLRDEQGNIAKWYGVSIDIQERKQAEQALKLFRSLLDQSTDAIEIIDPPSLRFIDCNQSAYLSLGYTREEFLSLSVWDIDPALDEELFARSNEEIDKTGAATFETLHQRKDGSVFPVEVSLKRARLERDYRLAVVRDISDRKRAEEALDERLRFETLVTELSAAFANTAATEVDKEIDRWLQRLAEVLNVDRATFFHVGDDGTTLYRSHSYTAPGIEPLPLTAVNEHFPWTTGEFLRGNTIKWSRIPDEIPEQATNEKAFAARVGVRSALSIPVLIGGSVVCALSLTSIRAFTTWPDELVARLRLVGEIFAAAVERKRSEAALRQAEQKYRDIFENAGEGIFQSTPDGRYIEANPALARMYGFDSPKELIHSCRDISRDVYVDPARREEFKQQIEEEGAVRGFEHEVFRRDGSKLWISVDAHSVQSGQGAIKYYEGTARDITKRKAAEEELKATTEQLRALSESLRKAKEEEGIRIARELHDELGSNLTSLKWSLLGLNRVKSKTSQAVSNEHEKITELVGLVDSTINTVRRISSELRPSVLDDLGLISAVEWHTLQFQENSGIVSSFESNVEHVELNREQSTTVFRIFQEAMTNILRHAQATKVNILIEEEDDQFVVEIKDNGKGITDDKLAVGSLGLLGMHERAHSIGGTVEITGSAGKGTLVTVRLPKRLRSPVHETNEDTRASSLSRNEKS